MDWRTHKKQLLKDPEFRKALQETALELQIAKSVIETRLSKGLSQQELAKKLKTKQSVISRVENAKTIPSLSFLQRLAGALGMTVKVELVP